MINVKDLKAAWVGTHPVKKIWLGTKLIKDFTATTAPKIVTFRDFPYKIGIAWDQSKSNAVNDAAFDDVTFVTGENGFGMNHLNPGLVAGITKYVPNAGTLRMDFAEADATCRFAIARNAVVNGAHLVWYGPTLQTHVTNIPSQYPTNAKEILTKFLQEHITICVTHFKTQFPGTVVSWNVMNEAIYAAGYKDENGVNIPSGTAKKSFWAEWFTLDEMAEIAYTAARAADPNCVLLYNDYDLETSNSGQSDKLESMMDVLAAKKIFRGGKQVLIDGVGFQFHSVLARTEGANSYSVVKARFKRWADKGKYVHVSELDFMTQVSKTDYAYTLYKDLGDASIEERLAMSYKRVIQALEGNVPLSLIWGITLWAPNDKTNFMNTKAGFNKAPGTIVVVNGVDVDQSIRHYPALFDYWGQPKEAYYRFLSMAGGTESLY